MHLQTPSSGPYYHEDVLLSLFTAGLDFVFLLHFVCVQLTSFGFEFGFGLDLERELRFEMMHGQDHRLTPHNPILLKVAKLARRKMS